MIRARYPFIVDRWTPDKVYSGAYKAWALTPDELIIYMPDYPVGHDEPINFSPGLSSGSWTAAPCRRTSRCRR